MEPHDACVPSALLCVLLVVSVVCAPVVPVIRLLVGMRLRGNCTIQLFSSKIRVYPKYTSDTNHREPPPYNKFIGPVGIVGYALVLHTLYSFVASTVKSSQLRCCGP